MSTLLHEKAPMSWGALNDEQKEALLPHVRNRTVIDLGAGDLVLAHVLAGELRAARVIAVDKRPMPTPTLDNIETVESTFLAMPVNPRAIVFLSWPENYPHDQTALQHAKCAKKFVYLGKNTDGNACGNHHLFQHLARRRVITYVPNVLNTMIVYDVNLQKRRKKLYAEEEAGITDVRVYGDMKRYVEVETYESREEAAQYGVLAKNGREM
jgi:hypothetical protein